VFASRDYETKNYGYLLSELNNPHCLVSGGGGGNDAGNRREDDPIEIIVLEDSDDDRTNSNTHFEDLELNTPAVSSKPDGLENGSLPKKIKLEEQEQKNRRGIRSKVPKEQEMSEMKISDRDKEYVLKQFLKNKQGVTNEGV